MRVCCRNLEEVKSRGVMDLSPILGFSDWWATNDIILHNDAMIAKAGGHNKNQYANI